MQRTAIMCLLALTLTGGRLAARMQAPAHAKISVVAEAEKAAPGETRWIGLLFELEPGWHIYWVNPGDSGLPPTVKWQMPAGFRAGAIRWPVPSRLTSATTVDYGYEGQVLLPLPLEVPAATDGAPVTLNADISYLICREVCLPAKAQASLTLTNGGVPSSAARGELFKTTRDRWPAPLPADMKIEASDAGSDVTLRIEPGVPAAGVIFYPLEPYQIDNAAKQQVEADGRGMRLTLKKAEPPEPFAVLKGVLVLGPGRAYAIEVPLEAAR